MIPVKQTVPHIPEEGSYGDCYRACLASILELPTEEVSHFMWDGCEDTIEVRSRINSFLSKYNAISVAVPFDSTTDKPIRELMKECNPGVYYILTGISVNNVPHSVVCYEDTIVNDPAPEPIKFREHTKDDRFWAHFVCRK